MTSVPAPSFAISDANPRTAEAEGDLLRRLAGCLAHHVNNALTGVIGHLELAQRGLSSRHPVAEHLASSRECAFQAAEAVKRIVAFACRLDVPQVQTRLSLAGLAEQTAERLRAGAGPGLTVRVSKDGPGWVATSEVLLQAALHQVLNNALEAMPAGGVLRLHVHLREETCCLTVSDTGGGIPSEVASHLFEPFRTTKSSGHLGLGMAQARELLQLLGGDVQVDSVPGQGASVTLSLPTVEAVEAQTEQPLDSPFHPRAMEAYAPACVGI